METVRFRISSLSLEIQVERNAKSFKKRNSVFHARVTVQSSLMEDEDYGHSPSGERSTQRNVAIQ